MISWHIKVIKAEKLCTLCLTVDMKLIDTYISLVQYKIVLVCTISQSLLFTIFKFEETSEFLLYLRLSKYFKAFSLFFLPSELHIKRIFSLEEIPHVAKSDLSFFTFL